MQIKDVAQNWRNFALQELGEREFAVALLHFESQMKNLEEITQITSGRDLAVELDLAFEEIVLILAESADNIRKYLALWWLAAHRVKVGEMEWTWLEDKIKEMQQ